MYSPPSNQDDTNVIKAIKGVKLNVRKKTILILLESNGEVNDEWEGIDALDESQQHLLAPFQEAIDHLQSIDIKSLGANDRAHEPGDENDEEYEVETILGVMHDREQILYYIKWDGWDIKFNNWEPEKNCCCDELAEPFAEAVEALKKQFDRPRAGPKSKTKVPARNTAKRSPKKNTSHKRDSGSSDEESSPPARKPGPKSKTRSLRSSTTTTNETKSPRKPGPRSQTIDKYFTPKKNDSPNGKSSPKKRPGPKSRTQVVSHVDSDDSNDGSAIRSKSARTHSDSDRDSDTDTSFKSEVLNKKPGPKSRTSVTPARKPGPKSRTMATPSSVSSPKKTTFDDDDSSDY